MKTTICIAGKNNIAVSVMEFCINNYKDYDFVAIPNDSQNYVNGWQKSFALFCKNNGIKCVTLEDVYDVDNLIFISLEYNKLIRPNKFIDYAAFII